MTEDEKKVLAALAKRYVAYQLVQALTESAKEACRTDFAENEEAVVHRDAVSLDVALERMRGNRVFPDVTDEDKKVLEKMVRGSGYHKVVQALSENAKRVSRNLAEYVQVGVEDERARIARVAESEDIALAVLVGCMKDNHFLRSFERA